MEEGGQGLQSGTSRQRDLEQVSERDALNHQQIAPLALAPDDGSCVGKVLCIFKRMNSNLFMQQKLFLINVN